MSLHSRDVITTLAVDHNMFNLQQSAWVFDGRISPCPTVANIVRL